MKYVVQDVNGQCLIEGLPGQHWVERIEDINRMLEACFENGVTRLLLYPENLTPQFFDLSSGEAGEILQKLRMHHIRVAIVRTPELRLSRLFGEVIRDESRGPYFRLFDEHSEAQGWLSSD